LTRDGFLRFGGTARGEGWVGIWPGFIVDGPAARDSPVMLALLGVNKAPGRMPPQPFFTPLVARHRRRLWHAINVVVA
jgi:hypothetical protein